jgi:hypothetical protein
MNDDSKQNATNASAESGNATEKDAPELTNEQLDKASGGSFSFGASNPADAVNWGDGTSNTTITKVIDKTSPL